MTAAIQYSKKEPTTFSIYYTSIWNSIILYIIICRLILFSFPYTAEDCVGVLVCKKLFVNGHAGAVNWLDASEDSIKNKFILKNRFFFSYTYRWDNLGSGCHLYLSPEGGLWRTVNFIHLLQLQFLPNFWYH